MGEFTSRVSSPITSKSTFKTLAGLTQVIDPDTPMHSVEGYGLQTPTSSIDGKSGDIDMLSEDPWSLNGCGSTMAPPKHPWHIHRPRGPVRALLIEAMRETRGSRV
ncbi:unnamed protein product [Aureobasidium pullulans]|nr:unnamed protein product [Aureobasidium pullulans]